MGRFTRIHLDAFGHLISNIILKRYEKKAQILVKQIDHLGMSSYHIK